MIYIPTNEIRLPQFHTDSFGYVFIWNGHFLRGVFPEAVPLANSLFNSGFVGEAIQKGLFPKTWISDYENEQFGLIIEHELISPVLYATEWNFEMLKDAALMVLQTAQLAWRYGFNMVDCHKRNVLFKGVKPVFVDIGSFIPRESGSTGWNPYVSFLHSYQFLLSLWSCGASSLAKRMMAPGLELEDQDYWIFKSVLFRRFPSLIRYYTLAQGGMCRIATWGEQRISRESRAVRALKPIVDRLKPSRSQRLNIVEKKVGKIKRKTSVKSLNPENTERVDKAVQIISSFFPDVETVTFINNIRQGYSDALFQNTAIKRIISIHESEDYSNAEYLSNKKSELPISNCHLRLKNNTILIRGKFPEDRLKSDVVFVPQAIIGYGKNTLRNIKGLLDIYLSYGKVALVLWQEEKNLELIELLKRDNEVFFEPLCKDNLTGPGYLIIYSSRG